MKLGGTAEVYYTPVLSVLIGQEFFILFETSCRSFIYIFLRKRGSNYGDKKDTLQDLS